MLSKPKSKQSKIVDNKLKQVINLYDIVHNKLLTKEQFIKKLQKDYSYVGITKDNYYYPKYLSFYELLYNNLLVKTKERKVKKNKFQELNKLREENKKLKKKNEEILREKKENKEIKKKRKKKKIVNENKKLKTIEYTFNLIPEDKLHKVSKDNLDSFVNSYSKYKLIPSNVEYLANKMVNLIDSFRHLHINIKPLIFYIKDVDNVIHSDYFPFSQSIDIHDKKKQEGRQIIETALKQQTEKYVDNYDKSYTGWLAVFYSTETKLPKKGGCSLKKRLRYTYQDKIMCVNPKSQDNNCIFGCMNEARKRFDKKIIYANTARKDLGFEKGRKIKVSELEKVANYFEIKINLYNDRIEFKESYGDFKDEIDIFLCMEHYAIIDVYKKTCEKCGRTYYDKHDEKNCSKRNRFIRRSNGEHFIDVNDKKQRKQPFSFENNSYFDFETLNNEETKNIHKLYAVGQYENGEYKDYIDTKGDYSTADYFMNEILKEGGKTLIAYNGSGYDFHFIMRECNKRNILTDEFLIYNGKIMNMTFYPECPNETRKQIKQIDKKLVYAKDTQQQIELRKQKKELLSKLKPNKLFDLYLFVLSSLDDACDKFEISQENKKKKFDHFKIKTFEDVKKNKEEIKAYLKNDVMALKELFEKFQRKMDEVIYKHFGFYIHITDFPTLSAMSYYIWSSTKKEDLYIELPNKRKMAFIRGQKTTGKIDGETIYNKGAIYGARCYPSIKNFQSKLYSKIKNNSKEKNKKIYLKMKEGKILDYVYNGDITSLYPSVMSLPQYEYPIGKSRFLTEKEIENLDINNLPIGFYDITYETNKNIILPILEQKENMFLRWNLHNNRGTYASPSIHMALEYGYKIKQIHNALVYESKNNKVFTNYVSSFKEMKDEGTQTKNKVLKMIGKIGLNALYGKMLMRNIDTQKLIVNEYDDLIKFYSEHNIKNVRMFDHQIYLEGEKLDKEYDYSQKPCQFGAFILSYSKIHMINYIFKNICPELNKIFMTYSDTDSCHMPAWAYHKLVEKNLIGNGSQFGLITNDVDAISKDKDDIGGLIIKEINLAPKKYYYEYLNFDGSISNCVKCKGIPKEFLVEDIYKEEEYDLEVVNEKIRNQLKKKMKIDQNDNSEYLNQDGEFKINSFKKTLFDKKEEDNLMNIKTIQMKRSFNKNNIWNGMEFDEKMNCWFPFGFVGKKEKVSGL